MSDLDLLIQQLADPSDLSWKEETYDLALARGLSPSDRSTYVAKLIDNARQGDTHAILTLGHLRATEALPVLQADGRSSEPWAATARRALVLLGKGAEVLAEIARDAVHGKAKMGRVAAVMDLAKIGGPVAIEALQQALVDEDSDVRVLAWDALVEALGLTKRIQNPDGKRELTTEVEVMRVLLGSDISALVKLGASGMREIARRLAAGATAQQLGLAWRPKTAQELFDKLRQALFDTDQVFPLDEIATLTGPSRQLAETMIVLRLEDWDERVPEALVQLDAAWTAPALAELAASPSAPVELQPKLADAARSLATS
jgi:hypothetical protein